MSDMLATWTYEASYPCNKSSVKANLNTWRHIILSSLTATQFITVTTPLMSLHPYPVHYCHYTTDVNICLQTGRGPQGCKIHTLLEETAHPTVYHHLGKLLCLQSSELIASESVPAIGKYLTIMGFYHRWKVSKILCNHSLPLVVYKTHAVIQCNWNSSYSLEMKQ